MTSPTSGSNPTYILQGITYSNPAASSWPQTTSTQEDLSKAVAPYFNFIQATQTFQRCLTHHRATLATTRFHVDANGASIELDGGTIIPLERLSNSGHPKERATIYAASQAMLEAARKIFASALQPPPPAPHHCPQAPIPTGPPQPGHTLESQAETIARLEIDLQASQAETHAAREEVQRVRQALEEKTLSARRLESALAGKEAELQYLRSHNESLQNSIETLTGENRTLQRDGGALDQARRELDRVLAENTRLNREIGALEERLRTLEGVERRNEGQAAELRALQETLQPLTSQKDAVDAELRASQARVAQLEAANAEQAASIQDLTTERDGLVSRLDRLESDLQESRATVSSLTARNSSLSAELEALRQQEQSSQAQIGVLEAEKRDLEARIQEQEASIAEIQQSLEQLQANNSATEAQVTQLERVLRLPDQSSKPIQERLRDIIAIATPYISEFLAQKGKLARKTAKLTNLREAHSGVEARRIALESELGPLREELRNAIDSVATMAREKSDLQSTLATLRQELSSQRGRIADQEATIAGLQGDLARLDSENQSIRSQLAEKIAEASRLTRLLASKTAKVTDLETLTGEQRAALGEMRKIYDALTSEVTLLRERNTALNQGFQILYPRYQELTRELEQIREAGALTKEQLSLLEGKLGLETNPSKTDRERLETIRRTADVYLAEFQSQRSALGDSERELAAKQRQMEAIEAQLLAKEANLAQSSQDLASSQASVRELTAHNRTLQGDLAALQQRLANNEATRSAQEREIAALRGENSALRASLERLTKENSDLSAQIALKSQQLSGQTEEIARNRTEISKLKGVKSSQAEKLESLDKILRKVGKKVADLNRDNKLLTLRSKEMTATNTIIEDKLAQFGRADVDTKRELTALEAILEIPPPTGKSDAERLASIREKASIYQINLSKQTDELEQNRRALGIEREQLATLTAQFQAQAEALRSTQAQLIEAEASVAQKDDENSQLRDQVASLQEALAQNRLRIAQQADQIRSIEEERNQLAQRIQEIEGSLASATEALARAVERNATLEAENQQLHSQLEESESELARLTGSESEKGLKVRQLEAQIQALQVDLSTRRRDEGALGRLELSVLGVAQTGTQGERLDQLYTFAARVKEEFSRLGAELAAKQEEIARLRPALAKTHSARLAAERLVKDLQQDLIFQANGAEAQYKDFQDQLVRAREENEVLAKRLRKETRTNRDQLLTQIQANQERIAELDTAVSRLEAALSDQAEQFQAEKSRLEAEVAHLQRVATATAIEIHSKETSLNEFRKMITSLTTEARRNDTLYRKIAQEVSELRALHKAHLADTPTIEELQKELVELMEKTSVEISKLKSSSQTQEKIIGFRNAQIAQLQTIISIHEGEIRARDGKISHLEIALEAARALLSAQDRTQAEDKAAYEAQLALFQKREAELTSKLEELQGIERKLLDTQLTLRTQQGRIADMGRWAIEDQDTYRLSLDQKTREIEELTAKQDDLHRELFKKRREVRELTRSNQDEVATLIQKYDRAQHSITATFQTQMEEVRAANAALLLQVTEKTSEISALEGKLQALQKELAERPRADFLEAKQKEIEDARSEKAAALAKAASQIEALELQLIQARAQNTSNEKAIHRLESTISTLRLHIQHSEEREALLVRHGEEKSIIIQDLQEKLRELKEALRTVTKEKNVAESLEKYSLNQLEEKTRELAEAQIELERLTDEQRRTERANQGLSQEIRELQEQKETATKELADLERRILGAAKALTGKPAETIALSFEEIYRQMKDTITSLNSMEGDLAETKERHTQELKALTDKLEEAEAQANAANILYANFSHQLVAANSRLAQFEREKVLDTEAIASMQEEIEKLKKLTSAQERTRDDQIATLAELELNLLKMKTSHALEIERLTLENSNLRFEIDRLGDENRRLLEQLAYLKQMNDVLMSGDEAQRKALSSDFQAQLMRIRRDHESVLQKLTQELERRKLHETELAMQVAEIKREFHDQSELLKEALDLAELIPQPPTIGPLGPDAVPEAAATALAAAGTFSATPPPTPHPSLEATATQSARPGISRRTLAGSDDSAEVILELYHIRLEEAQSANASYTFQLEALQNEEYRHLVIDQWFATDKIRVKVAGDAIKFEISPEVIEFCATQGDSKDEITSLLTILKNGIKSSDPSPSPLPLTPKSLFKTLYNNYLLEILRYAKTHSSHKKIVDLTESLDPIRKHFRQLKTLYEEKDGIHPIQKFLGSLINGENSGVCRRLIAIKAVLDSSESTKYDIIRFLDNMKTLFSTIFSKAILVKKPLTSDSSLSGRATLLGASPSVARAGAGAGAGGPSFGSPKGKRTPQGAPGGSPGFQSPKGVSSRDPAAGRPELLPPEEL